MVGDRNRGFEPEDAVGTFREPKRFRAGRMRRVVGREHQDAVLHGAAQFGAVLVVAEGRRHLEVGVVRRHVVAAQEQVVRRRLGGDGQPFALRRADERHARRRRNVLDVEAAARHAAKREVAANRVRLDGDGNDAEPEPPRKRRVADDVRRGRAAALPRHRVLADDQPEFRRAPHRRFHHMVVLDIRAVVREERHARRRQRFEVGDCAPEPPLGEARRRDKPHGRIRRARRLPLILDLLGRIARGRGVRHRDDRGKTAALRGGEAARRRFRRRHAGIAEMHVHVDEPRKLVNLFHWPIFYQKNISPASAILAHKPLPILAGFAPTAARLCAGRWRLGRMSGDGAEVVGANERLRGGGGWGERSPRGFRFAKMNLRARSVKFRRIENASMRNTHGSTSTSPNRLHPSAVAANRLANLDERPLGRVLD